MKNLRHISFVALFAASALAQSTERITPEQLKEESVIFTPPGFAKVGEAKWAGTAAWLSGMRTGFLELVVRDAASDALLPARINVVGPDGNFYQPPSNRLERFAFTGTYPNIAFTGGNRIGKPPYRYLGRFFYIAGETKVQAPAGKVRIEVWRGYEFRPQTIEVDLPPGGTRRVEVKLTRAAPMAPEGYYAGDTHLHMPRLAPADDHYFFDMMDLEDIRYGVNMAWNQVGDRRYLGFMDAQVDPQRALGRASLATRGHLQFVSGQEYRSRVYGHLNLSFRDDLAIPAQNALDTDTWPVYGLVARETIDRGGFAFMAHGGYEQEIYADAALGNTSGIELLQFGIYRSLGLGNWYNILNSGYRFAAHGASDYPATRFLADCRTYVYSEQPPTMHQWLVGVATGRSFFTSGPLLLLEVDGQKPGAQIKKSGAGPHRVNARMRMRCEVTPITDLDIIVNGKVAKTLKIPAAESKGRWIEFEHAFDLDESSWIAARAHSLSPGGQPDAEAHTNPVYVYVNGRAPFNVAALDSWIGKIDAQLAIHSKRLFPESVKVLNYFQQAREFLLKIRAQGGLADDDEPARLVQKLNATVPNRRNLAQDGAATDATDDEIKAFLDAGAPPPTSTAAALKGFEMVGGFHMELVAAEPLLRSPVAGAFDENGNLFVAELTDYPYNPRGRVKVAWQREFTPGAEPVGGVRLLRDIDCDGVYDTSTVFADKLLWVGGIVPWKGGVFVSSPPDIWYMKDTDSDGVADVRQKVFTGFGTLRQEHFVNNLQLGLDHFVYGATGGNGGEIRTSSDPAAVPVSLNGHDFRFAPDTWRLELQTGTKEFGMSFDDWGRRYVCDEGHPCFQIVLPLRYVERNPWFAPREAIFTTTPEPTPIFRISPIERWRFLKSSRRFAGTDRPADIAWAAGMDVGLGSNSSDYIGRQATGVGVSNYVIDAAAGVTVYRGGAYPPEYRGNIFVTDSLANLVHRRVPVPDGAAIRTERADAGTEFLRSPNNWFRPVNFINAPDGTLYVIDMAREYSESANIPPDIEKHMDLTSGRERGRIYRMAPPGYKPAPPPRLGRASSAELVATLESPHGWQRDTAHRLLYERQDKSAAPALEKLASEGVSPQARLHALWSLHGLGSLSDRLIFVGLCDPHGGVRENALLLAEPRLASSTGLREKVFALAGDPEASVRLQVAFTAGESNLWDQAALLARLARENFYDPWICSAIISSATACGGDLVAALAGDDNLRAAPKGLEFMRSLVTAVGFQNRPTEVERVLAALPAVQTPAASLPLLNALVEGLKLAGTTLAAADRAQAAAPLLRQARVLAQDLSQPDAVLFPAVDTLGAGTYASAAPVLATLLAPKQSAARQLAAIGVLRRFAEPLVGTLLIDHYAGLAPEARNAAVDALLERTERIDALLSALKAKTVPRADLSTKHVATLRQQADERVRDRVADVLGAANVAKRQDVFRNYLPALDLTGGVPRGRAIFTSRCSICHRLAGAGTEFGPDLNGAHSGGPEKLLTSIIDPNREIAPQYFFQQIETKNGESIGGILKNESAAAVTLTLVGGVTKTVARGNIARMQTLRQSLMPEGLESGLNQQDMADLLAFIASPEGNDLKSFP